MGSLTTSVPRAVEIMRFWSTGATAEHVANGVTGERSIPSKWRGSKSQSWLSTRQTWRGSLDDGRTNRSCAQRCTSRAGETADALTLLNAISKVFKSLGSSSSSSWCRGSATTLAQTLSMALRDPPSMVQIVDAADLRDPLLKALPRRAQLRHPWKCPDGTVSAGLGQRVPPV